MKLSTGQAGISTLAALGALCALFLPWNGWLSLEVIDSKSQLAAITQWQTDYGKKIDFLVERNGANPAAITRFYHVASSTSQTAQNEN